jgi:hypothetical protein
MSQLRLLGQDRPGMPRLLERAPFAHNGSREANSIKKVVLEA